MSGYKVAELTVRPAMDFELLLENSGTSRIEGRLMNELMDRWAAWAPHLQAKRLVAGQESYLAVWLDAAVEKAVDQLWGEAPSEAFFYNALAQTLCMSAIYDLLPEVSESGCAPAPGASVALKEALEGEGLRDRAELGARAAGLALNRRYAVVTYYPFRGGCEVCDLQTECPRLKSREDVYSVLLPGQE